ncbi:MAG: FAD-dependent oxidoreductase [Pseudomonadota bacterium]
MQANWGVIGGGVLGQVTALRLAEQGHRVTLVEAADDIGGLAASWTVGDVTWDKFYHVILPFDDRLLALLDELGLSDAVEWKRTKTGFFADGRLSPLNGALDYLRLPVLGLVAKLRLAAHLMLAARIRNGAPLEQVRVGDWLTKYSGRRAYERVWQPLLRAKLGENSRIASAAFIWASIRRLYLARQGSEKAEVLGYVSGGGYRRILDALAERLRDKGVKIVVGRKVTAITSGSECHFVDTAHGGWVFDRVVSTLPAPVTAKLCQGLTEAEVERLNAVTYQGIICASVVLDRPLAGNYLTYLTDPDLPFTAIVETSALTGAFDGKTLVYLPRYVTQDDPYWGLDDDELRQQFVEGLRAVHPDIPEDAVQAFRVARVRHVMAVPTVGYRDIAPPVTTSVPGLYVVNSAQIIDGTLNVDATLGVLDRALPELKTGAVVPRLEAAE